MKAGYLITCAIKEKLKTWRERSVINWLAAHTGAYTAGLIVAHIVKCSVAANAAWLASHVTWLAWLAGPVAGVAITFAAGL